jgi:HNH endonuclease
MNVPRVSIYIHRFWEKVEKRGETECWVWRGYIKPSGHGLTSLKGFPIHASRKAWILTHGPIRGDLCVNHRCDNALCCNPAHLYLGTRSDNMIDRWANLAPEKRGTLGRPHVLDESQLDRLWEMRRTGSTLAQCAQEFGVHVATVCRYITTVRREKLSRLRKKMA